LEHHRISGITPVSGVGDRELAFKRQLPQPQPSRGADQDGALIEGFCHSDRKSCPERSRMGGGISYCFDFRSSLRSRI